MTPEHAFCLYFGINLHFTQKDYSVIKYGSNTKVARNKWESMRQEQRYRFEWYSNKFSNTQDMLYAFIGCKFDQINGQYDSKDDIIKSFNKFKSRRESLSYTIKSDARKHELLGNLEFNKLIYKYFVGEYSPEYILLLDHTENMLESMYSDQNLSWCRDKILTLIKYKVFFNFNKYLTLLNQNEQATC